MKRLALGLCALLALPGLAAQAADLQIIGMTNEAYDIQEADPTFGCTHRITGAFGPGDGARIGAAIRQSSDAWRDQGLYGVTVVCLDSPGGALPEALTLAAQFREQGIGTRLEAGARCESACALLFMAGSFYAHESGLYKWRIMHPTAKLGFHAFKLEVPQGQYDGATVSKAYALAMETLARTVEDLMQNRGFEDGEHIKPSLVAAMLRTPPESMMYVETVDQAGRWGIDVGPLRTAGMTLQEMDFRRACTNRKAWEADETATRDSYWQDHFVTWTSEDWGDTLEVTTNDMSGDGCQYSLPTGAARSRSARLEDAYINAIEPLDPMLRLDRLPY
ncbi:hypothetical protein [Maliponia aquimaris]|uniref:Periplasmic protein-like protein n=1 Tax=Maliponia aquimaris TaxID=1673631 RepID=A0A238KS10_9RHOB|nr:hypothetical protein [Maliponia aquimaris]SMX44912.1 hypothetical protein MAA8898_03091 [Maliponia aquimaris]